MNSIEEEKNKLLRQAFAHMPEWFKQNTEEILITPEEEVIEYVKEQLRGFAAHSDPSTSDGAKGILRTLNDIQKSGDSLKLQGVLNKRAFPFLKSMSKKYHTPKVSNGE